MVREFVDRVFNGSAEPASAHLVETAAVGAGCRRDPADASGKLRKEEAMTGNPQRRRSLRARVRMVCSATLSFPF